MVISVFGDEEHVLASIAAGATGYVLKDSDAGNARGHGLSNMMDRARRIGGDLKIQPSSSGTTLSLLLPIA